MSGSKEKSGSGIYMAQVVRYLNVLDILMRSDRALSVKEIVRRLEFKGDFDSSEKQVRIMLDYISLEYGLSEDNVTPEGRRSKSLFYRIESGREVCQRLLLSILLPKSASAEGLELLIRLCSALDELNDPADPEAVKAWLKDKIK